jgi:hypothetical protein
MATNFMGRSLTANIAEQHVDLNMGFIYLISNDSANTVTLSFDIASASATELMVLKAGESRLNLDFPIGTLYYKADVDTSALRIEGLKRKDVNY